MVYEEWAPGGESREAKSHERKAEKKQGGNHQRVSIRLERMEKKLGARDLHELCW